jgi:hypothetical protein
VNLLLPFQRGGASPLLAGGLDWVKISFHLLALIMVLHMQPMPTGQP